MTTKRKKKPAPITVRVTAKDIKEGKAQRCHSCPVALALNRAFFPSKSQTFRADANVYESWGILLLEVWGLSIAAPWEVREFVDRFDFAETRHLCQPFTFIVPPQDDPEWLATCADCGERYPPGEIKAGECVACSTVGVAE